MERLKKSKKYVYTAANNTKLWKLCMRGHGPPPAIFSSANVCATAQHCKRQRWDLPEPERRTRVRIYSIFGLQLAQRLSCYRRYPLGDYGSSSCGSRIKFDGNIPARRLELSLLEKLWVELLLPLLCVCGCLVVCVSIEGEYRMMKWDECACYVVRRRVALWLLCFLKFLFSVTYWVRSLCVSIDESETKNYYARFSDKMQKLWLSDAICSVIWKALQQGGVIHEWWKQSNFNKISK